MARKPTGNKPGVPLIPIDWKIVDDLLMAGCTGTEVASYFGVHPDTLYLRCQDEKKMGFTEYRTIKKQKGDSLLRATQYKVAIDKDKTMLIWLGKQRLGQREDPQQEDSFNGELKEFMSFLREDLKKETTVQ